MSQTVFNTMKDFCTLLIDDDDLIRDSLGIVFNANSQQFIAVESAEKGLDLIEKKKIDVIICDYRLPGMNGFEFFKRVSKFLPNVVKILITAYGDDEELCSLRWMIKLKFCSISRRFFRRKNWNKLSRFIKSVFLNHSN